MWCIGIDPGTNGGIAAISISTKSNIEFSPMPDTRTGLGEWLGNELGNSHPGSNIVCVEQVGGFMGGSSNDNSESSRKKNIASAHTMFNFGMEYERCIMTCLNLGY